MQLLAHSARPERGIPAQEYAEHVAAVRRGARENAVAALGYRSGDQSWFASLVDWAATYHDLGKLHDGNQKSLASGKRTAALEVNHVDAGTAYMIRSRLREPAITVYGHHIGLVDSADELKKAYNGGAPFRDGGVRERVDGELDELIRWHRSVVDSHPANGAAKTGEVTGLERRLMMSCLVDADHSDTARHYGETEQGDKPPARWEERLSALDAYVGRLAAKGGERTAYRTELYERCREQDQAQSFLACDSPVGSGKTTAVMAYLLRAALQRNLRHVFVVLPYTSIIRQAVKTYREAISLPGEDAESVVAAHHHGAEFRTMTCRHLTTLWQSPVIVTTAVQFFETLGAAATAKLRKLHELPGSAVFIDEAHAAMPISLWPYYWNQMEELAGNWGCRFVLGSGSLAKFWENRRLVKFLAQPRAVPLMAPGVLRSRGEESERQRVEYRSRPEAIDLGTLANWIESQVGPRLVVMNTVQSAAVVAKEMREHGGDVLHLSTALAPSDREKVVERIEGKLKGEKNGAWTLVATSCVEAGLDFDFASGFRERARAASLVQLGGRVNRHGARGRSTVWDFVTNDTMLSQHPEFQAARRVVAKLFETGMWSRMSTTELITLALDWELTERSEQMRIETIAAADKAASYRSLAKETRLIQTETKLVVVDSHLTGMLAARERVGWKTLLRGSVQLWGSRIEKLKLEAFPGLDEVYRWNYEYDPGFLGIMAGALRLLKGDHDGFLIV